MQHYLQQIGLEVQDGCIMLDPTGRIMWSEINQDCMRVKQREVTNANGEDVFDKEVWRAAGSSVEESVLDKWTQLNNLLHAHLGAAHSMSTRWLPPQVSALTDADADAVLVRPVTPPGSKAIDVTANKYADKTDEFTLARLGVKLVRREGRCLRVDYEIVDAGKFAKAFCEGVSVHFVPTRPKDMPGLLAQGILDGTVTNSSVMENFPTVARLIASVPARHGHFARARRPAYLGVQPDTYKIQRVLGSSESYLVNDPRETYLLCNAIISTGSTIQGNDLDVWKVIKGKGEIAIGLYQQL
ncbi:hypothetical protein CSUB01_11458 [Colletotrichum sublineola]|uniref:ATP phosphoribosyltransferase n=1 Tax=Colletotrichum sublineola TaxID=1173701 RepID=A0A066XIZ0_COLSU|nr:hypothetical protein CSUB01_11458 [Colletotrichum sublineola]